MHKPKPKPKTSIDTWNGKPLLKVEGPFRPFRMSVAKCGAILELVDQIREFYEANKHLLEARSKAAPRREPTPEELAIIAKYVKNAHHLMDQPLTDGAK